MKKRSYILLCSAIIGCATMVWAQFPLKVDIDVSTKRDSRQIGAGDEGEVKTESVIVKVKIRKSGGDLSEGQKLQAELYVIGKQIQTGNYGIMGVEKKEFELLKDDDYSFEFTSKPYRFGTTGGNINVGGKYESYLVVVVDADGEVVDWRCGRHIQDKGVALIRSLGPKTMFDKDGNVIGELKNPGEAFKIAAPAAVSSDDD